VRKRLESGLATGGRIEVAERHIEGHLVGSPGPNHPVRSGLGGGEADAVADRVGEKRSRLRERKDVDHDRQAPWHVGHGKEVQVGQVDGRVAQGARAGQMVRHRGHLQSREVSVVSQVMAAMPGK